MSEYIAPEEWPPLVPPEQNVRQETVGFIAGDLLSPPSRQAPTLPPLGRAWYHAIRSTYDVLQTRQMLSAVAGADTVADRLAEFAAHDAWENEGGALAYQHR